MAEISAAGGGGSIKEPTPRPMAEISAAGLSAAGVESVAGLSAGTVATLVVHPLDVVKTRMQVHRASAASKARPRPSTAAVLGALTASDRPLASLYRGLTPNLVGNASGWAAFFFVKARVERTLACRSARRRRAGRGGDDDHDGRGQRGHEQRSPAPPPSPSVADFFVASAVAGAVTTALTNPIWVLKTRMLASDRGSAGAYPSMVAGARALYAAEGIAGFYRGLGVSMLGVSHGAVQFAAYESAKRFYFARQAQSADSDVDGARTAQQQPPLTSEATVVLSSAAKLVAGAVTYPHQVLRSRLQMQGADDDFGRGLRSVMARTWRDEGIAGFYRGLVPGVVRVLPATWVTFIVYEKVKYHLPRWLA